MYTRQRKQFYRDLNKLYHVRLRNHKSSLELFERSGVSDRGSEIFLSGEKNAQARDKIAHPLFISYVIENLFGNFSRFFVFTNKNCAVVVFLRI
jgi:hypothetical protein